MVFFNEGFPKFPYFSMGSAYFLSRDDWDCCGQIRKISATNTWIAFTCHQIVYIPRVSDKLLRVWEFQTDQDGEQARQEQAEGPGLPLHRQEHCLPHQWCKEKSATCCSHFNSSIHINWFASLGSHFRFHHYIFIIFCFREFGKVARTNLELTVRWSIVNTWNLHNF